MGAVPSRVVALDLRQSEQAWLRALREHDLLVLRDLLHEEFTSTPARCAGDVLGKREYLQAVLNVSLCDYSVQDVMIVDLGPVAVVKQRLTCRFPDLRIEDDLLITDVWARYGERWLAITRHSSSVMQSQM